MNGEVSARGRLIGRQWLMSESLRGVVKVVRRRRKLDVVEGTSPQVLSDGGHEGGSRVQAHRNGNGEVNHSSKIHEKGAARRFPRGATRSGSNRAEPGTRLTRCSERS